MSLSFTIFTLITIIGVLLIVASGIVLYNQAESNFWATTLVAGFIMVGCAAIFWLIVLITIPAAHYSESKCERYAEQNERVTKFARYTYWDWDCLVQTNEGWIPKSQLYVDEGPGR